MCPQSERGRNDPSWSRSRLCDRRRARAESSFDAPSSSSAYSERERSGTLEARFRRRRPHGSCRNEIAERSVEEDGWIVGSGRERRWIPTRRRAQVERMSRRRKGRRGRCDRDRSYWLVRLEASTGTVNTNRATCVSDPRASQLRLANLASIAIRNIVD